MFASYNNRLWIVFHMTCDLCICLRCRNPVFYRILELTLNVWRLLTSIHYTNPKWKIGEYLLATHISWLITNCNHWIDFKNLSYIHLHIQHTANNLVDSSGGVHSGKNGFKTYTLNVSATIACEHGRTIIHSIQRRMKAINGPKVSIM